MSGFNYELGKSNNALDAIERGMTTLGRWAKRHGVSAAAAESVMRPTEYHHTGTGRRGKSRATWYVAADLEPTAEHLSAMKEFDRAAKVAKQAPPTVYIDCVCRRLYFPRYARTRAGKRPEERIDRVHEVRIFADGRIACLEANSANPALSADVTTGWEKMPGVVIAKDGELIYDNVNARFDDANEIAKRIS